MILSSAHFYVLHGFTSFFEDYCNKHGIYELPHELQNDLIPRALGN